MIDFYLPPLFIILALTYQMCFYLFYKYFQIRKENLGLNKFLIAFGLLYGFGFTVIPPVDVEVNASERVGALNPVPKDVLEKASKLPNILSVKQITFK